MRTSGDLEYSAEAYGYTGDTLEWQTLLENQIQQYFLQQKEFKVSGLAIHL